MAHNRWGSVVPKLGKSGILVPVVLFPTMAGLGGWFAGLEGAGAGAFLAAVLSLLWPKVRYRFHEPDDLTGLMKRDQILMWLDETMSQDTPDRTSGALVLNLDEYRNLEDRYDQESLQRIVQTVGERISDQLRSADRVARLEDAKFAVALAPERRLDLEATIQLISRLQQSIAEPIPDGSANLYVSASAGFALTSRVEKKTGQGLIDAAIAASVEAGRAGAGSIRSYSPAMKSRIESRGTLSSEVFDALEKGEIVAFFQPQVSLETGEVSGLEVLSRWIHPEKGMIPPVEFLPALEDAGLMARLGEVMVHDGVKAIRQWDELGLEIPHIGVNFATTELLDPNLIDRLRFELDRYEIAPERLVVEVLESVVGDQSSNLVVKNLAGLAQLGCCLDLDDFGTGHASITNIRRFSIARIKVDRSFVTRVDEDESQRQMLLAILTMAQNLGVGLLAEGVETEGELATLRQMGCSFGQGFAIARPMDYEAATKWLIDRQKLLGRDDVIAKTANSA